MICHRAINELNNGANEPKSMWSARRFIFGKHRMCVFLGQFYCHFFNNSFNVEKYRKIAAAAADISHTVNHLWHCNFNACLSLMNIEHKLSLLPLWNAVDHEPHYICSISMSFELECVRTQFFRCLCSEFASFFSFVVVIQWAHALLRVVLIYDT